ncbi:fimbria/pilus outer membrane usher protein (plasmid) [Salmonella enterica subsp. enterica serovar 4,12:i:-]|uniref:fimbria/pilus outer membrane usher protein n=1 Tax=Salmonella enterica TaxID=28901 RepID=UPI0027D26423|nr:fimbria/pilus outer membrane usher protein [Salmonella enterica]WMC28626.1 fimbria/pilus outer membrane usher protein [Salmonella enterica subsp. enterica serovar 4,12:i:-]
MPAYHRVANSTSRVTISQNGYAVYSKVVPPGPYQLDDVRSVGNGDLVVTWRMRPAQNHPSIRSPPADAAASRGG